MQQQQSDDYVVRITFYIHHHFSFALKDEHNCCLGLDKLWLYRNMPGVMCFMTSLIKQTKKPHDWNKTLISNWFHTLESQCWFFSTFKNWFGPGEVELYSTVSWFFPIRRGCDFCRCWNPGRRPAEGQKVPLGKRVSFGNGEEKLSNWLYKSNWIQTFPHCLLGQFITHQDFFKAGWSINTSCLSESCNILEL